jgi:NADPH-dependent curcumin reductase CurA
VICGLISQYNDKERDWPGPRNFDQMIMKRLTVGGFVVLDHMADRSDEAVAAIAGWMSEGKIKPLETIDESGLENAPNVLNRLYDGDNVGKLLVKVADPPVAA